MVMSSRTWFLLVVNEGTEDVGMVATFTAVRRLVLSW
jgi:hypothetical protein